MNLGTGPILSLYLGIPANVTIPASMAGTAAAVQIISTADVTTTQLTYARSMEIFNLTGRNLEVIIRPDGGTADYTATNFTGTAYTVSAVIGKQGQFFVPGTASATVAGRTNRFAIQFQPGMVMSLRTTENTAVTASATQPFIINFWA